MDDVDLAAKKRMMLILKVEGLKDVQISNHHFIELSFIIIGRI